MAGENNHGVQGYWSRFPSLAVVSTVGGRPFACFLHQLFHKQQMVAVVEAQLSGHEQVQVQ